MLGSLLLGFCLDREMTVPGTEAWVPLRLREQGGERRKNQPRRLKRKVSEVIRGR